MGFNGIYGGLMGIYGGLMGSNGIYPLVMTDRLLLKMAEIGAIYPLQNGDFSVVMLVYQSV